MPKPLTFTKRDLASRLADVSGKPITEEVANIQRVLDVIQGTLLNGYRIELRDFGVFSVKECAARIGRNPKTKAEVQIPAHNKVHFKPGRLFVEAFHPERAATMKAAEARHAAKA